jgi:hypothetical protein
VTGIPSPVFVVPHVVLAIAVVVWAWRFARRAGIAGDALAGMLAAASAICSSRPARAAVISG